MMQKELSKSSNFGMVQFLMSKLELFWMFCLIKPAVVLKLLRGAMRAVLESAGVHNVLAKSKGSSNPHNVVKATVDALTKMRDAYTIAQQRGVDLNKVFNG